VGGPSKAWYWVAGVVGVLAVGVGAFLMVAAFVGYFDRIDDFQRVEVPGGGEVAFEDPGGYTVYFEAPGAADREAPRINVSMTSRDGGEPVELRDYTSTVTYTTGEREGTAFQSFRIDEPGVYTVTARGEAVGELAFGRGLGLGPIRRMLAGVVVAGTGVLAAAGLVLYVALKRIGARRRFPPPQHTPAV
jgi:hypothetical protein